MPEPAIILQDVTVKINGNVILNRVTGTIERGCLTAIIGPNGAGKTTLLHAILGLLPYQGRIRFGDNGEKKPPRIGYVPQKLELDRGSPLTVLDFMAACIATKPLWAGISKSAAQESMNVLERLGVANVLRLPIGRISGGELQRVLLGVALLGDPEILLLDEPIAAVDIAGETLFCDVLEDVQKSRGLTIVLVSHDLAIVTSHARNVLCLNRRITCAGAAGDVLTRENLERLFSSHVGLYIHKHAHFDPR